MLLSEWIGEVRKGGDKLKIVPRILFEGWSIETYQQLFASTELKRSLGNFIAEQLSVSVFREKNS